MLSLCSRLFLNQCRWRCTWNWRVRILLLCVFCGVTLPAVAELYRWQDANGNWQFSDAPPEGEAKTQAPEAAREGVAQPADLENEATDPGENLALSLSEKFPDQTPIARATLAVVAIETALGSGSGFFITDSGHIITNKHVVRPTQTPGMKASLAEVEQQTLRFNALQRELTSERRALSQTKRELDSRRAQIDRMEEGGRRAMAEEDYDEYFNRYAKRKNDFDAADQRFRAERSEFERFRSDLSIKSSLAGLAKRFVIYLKGDTKAEAVLVSLSKKHDLALLRLESAQTPSLAFSADKRLSQGSIVFAVGSPMGMRDSVTKGIITGYRDDFILTDAQILPGNSGGPLVNEAGVVVGINTMKLAQEANRQGFGLAIPVAAIREAFSQYLPEQVLSTLGD